MNDDGTSTLSTANSELDDMSGKGATLQGVLEGVASGFTFAFVTTALSAIKGAGDALMGFIGDSLSAADKHDKAIAQLQATLKSTSTQNEAFTKVMGAQHPVTQMTIDDLTGLAQKMSTHTLFTSDQYLAAEQYMLQMGTIGKDVFPTAMQATADLATRMNVDLTSASMTVAKALAQPQSGIGRLNTQFKLFDKTQLATIQHLADSGQTVKAQTLILDALTKAVGGSADAAAQAGLGPWQLLGNEFEIVKDAVGEALIPALDTIGKSIAPIIDQVLPKLTDLLTTKVGPALSTVTGVIGKFIGGITSGETPMNALENALTSMGVPDDVYTSVVNFAQQVITFVTVDVPQFIIGVQDFVKSVQDIAKGVSDTVSKAGVAWGQLTVIFWAVLFTVSTAADQLVKIVELAVLGALKAISDGGNKIGDGLSAWGPIFDNAKIIVDHTGDQIKGGLDAWGPVFQNGLTIVTTIMARIGLAINTGVNDATTFIQGGLSAWGGIWGNLVTIVSTVFNNVVNGIRTAAGDVLGAVTDAFNRAVTGAQDVISGFTDLGSAVISNVVGGITGVINDVGTELKKGPAGWLTDLKGALHFEDAGSSIINGIIAGIGANVGALIDKVKALATSTFSNFMATIIGHSPSKLFMTAGQSITSGLALGISGTAHLPMQAMNNMTQQIVGGSSMTNSGNTTNHYYMGAALYQPQSSSGNGIMQAFRES